LDLASRPPAGRLTLSQSLRRILTAKRPDRGRGWCEWRCTAEQAWLASRFPGL